jgi:hypothetical protein
MQAAIDAAPERAAGQQQAAYSERPAALPRRPPDAGDDRRPVLSASSLACISGPEDVTQPIPVISGSASRGALSPAVVEPEPEPVVEPEPEPVVEPEPEPVVEPEPEPVVEQSTDHQPATAMRAPTDRPAQQQVSVRKAPASRRHRVAGVFVTVIILVTTGSLAFALSRHAATAGDGRGASPNGPGAEVATRNLAAAWVSAQVGRAATVSCDPVMCRTLEGHGIPAGDLLELSRGAADPLRSKVIVATPAIRREFGGRLSSVYAPAVIASFGSGSQRIDIRAIARHGAAAYESALSADLRARIASRTLLLGGDRIVVSAEARRQLSAGQVDSRLLITIAGMAARHPLRIVAFGDSGPSASAGIPLRSADLTELDEGHGTSSPAFIQSMLTFLRTQRRRYLPARAGTARLAGQTVLRIEFAAPSPLGLLSPRAP